MEGSPGSAAVGLTRRPAPGPHRRGGTLFLELCAWAVRFVLLVFCAAPLYWMVASSIKPSVELLATPPTLWPQTVTFSAYVRLSTATTFWTYFLNSVLVSAATTVLVVAAGSLGAYSLTRYQFRARQWVGRVLLVGYIFPPILLVVPLFIFAFELGLTNSRVGVSLANMSFALPFALWILRAFFQSVPPELEEAAMTDGASRLQALVYIVGPMALPGVIATSIFTFIVSWNDYVIASVLINWDELKTLPVGINDLFQALYVDWGLIMAAGVLVTIPALGCFVALQRYLIEGWGSGGIKG
jgi:multiple sugar transport system permease protein